LIINGKGNEKRDFLYIDDFLNFINSVIKKQKSKFEIYNCSYGKSFKIKKILEKIIKISNYKKKIIYNNKAKNINVNILVNSNKAKKELGWFPKIKIDNGLTKAIEWYKKNYDKKFL
jgi:nucleoside-diphosphate-sugar epimerase